MNKQHKINYIKFWLQCFGERDNETFSKDVTINDQTWRIWLQYNFDNEGDQIEPYSNVSCSDKLVKGLSFEDLTEEQLNSLIKVLRKYQTHW